MRTLLPLRLSMYYRRPDCDSSLEELESCLFYFNNLRVGIQQKANLGTRAIHG